MTPVESDLGGQEARHCNALDCGSILSIVYRLYGRRICIAVEVSSPLRQQREITCSVSGVCLQSAAAPIIHLSMPHSPPLGINKCAPYCSFEKILGCLASPQNVECQNNLVRITMQSDNGFEKVSTAVPTVETISTKICQMAQKKGDKGGLKRTAQKCGASKSGGAGRHSDFAEVLPGNGTSLSFPKFCWVIVGPIGCRLYCGFSLLLLLFLLLLLPVSR